MKIKIITTVISVFSCVFIYSQNRFQAPFNKGVLLIESGEYEAAISQLSEALRMKDQAPNKHSITDAYLYRALCRSRLHNHEMALMDVDKALELKREYMRAYVTKTGILFDAKRYVESVVVADTGLRMQPSNEELLVAKGKAFNAQKKFGEARTSLHQVLSNNPNNIDAIRLLGVVSMKEHQWDSSVFYFSKVLQISPLDAASFYDRGISKSYVNDLAGASDDIETAMKLDTSSRFIGYNNLGFFLKLEQQDYAGALPYFDKSIALAPGFGYAYSNRSYAKLKLNDLPGAKEDIKKAIELDGKNAYAYKNLGLIQLQENNIKKACQNFKKALDLGYTEMYDNEVDQLLSQHCK